MSGNPALPEHIQAFHKTAIYPHPIECITMLQTHASWVFLTGSGKSHLALLGCGIEHAIIIRSDATRQRIAPNYPDLELYSRDMHKHTYQAMLVAARTALQSGYSVILDATFLHPGSRLQAYQLARSCHVVLSFYWLDIDSKQLRDNIQQRQQQGHDISDADLNVLRSQLQQYQRPDEAWIQFIHSSQHWPHQR